MWEDREQGREVGGRQVGAVILDVMVTMSLT